MKVAIIGSGVSGLAATWVLNEYSDHEIHLYESDYRPGGHANTVKYLPSGRQWHDGVDVDTGFIVCNPSTYPNFLRFLALYAPRPKAPLSWISRLLSWSRRPSTTQEEVEGEEEGITIIPTEMTFSISRDAGAFEWAGKNPMTVFCQPHRILDTDMWRMVYDVLRFNACSRRLLLEPEADCTKPELSIGDYLAKEKYSLAFRDNYLIPMTAAIWSTPPEKCILDFPARTLIQFMYNHHLLQITGKPSWLTIKGGSHKYVNKILSTLPSNQLHLSTPITSAASLPANEGQRPKIILKTAEEEAQFDHVIFACHSDTALNILEVGNITEDERRILSAFQWNKNEAILHSDIKLMPKSRLAWSCWNYLTTSVQMDANEKGSPVKPSPQGINIDTVSLTYGMNDLQHISEARYGPVLVSLNPVFEPAADKVVGRWQYDHPVLDANAVNAQKEMHKIQNKRSITFAGAYLKYGFHEDGFTSGLLAACAIDEESGDFPTPPFLSDSLRIPTRRLTIRPPFDIQYADHHLTLQRRGPRNLEDLLARLFDWLEVSGLREFIGVLGSLVLHVFSILLGLKTTP